MPWRTTYSRSPSPNRSTGRRLSSSHDRLRTSTKVISRQAESSVPTDSTNCLTQLSMFLPRRTPRSDPALILHQHFERHVLEDFLPAGVYVFGRCEQAATRRWFRSRRLSTPGYAIEHHAAPTTMSECREQARLSRLCTRRQMRIGTRQLLVRVADKSPHDGQQAACS